MLKSPPLKSMLGKVEVKVSHLFCKRLWEDKKIPYLVKQTTSGETAFRFPRKKALPDKFLTLAIETAYDVGIFK